MINDTELPPWVNDYLSIPFVDGGRDHSGSDCYGMSRLILKERYGIELPLYGKLYEHTGETEKVSHGVLEEAAQEHWKEIYRKRTPTNDLVPQYGKEGDVVLFTIAGHPVHVGVLLTKDHMLNIFKGSSAKIEDINGLFWGRRLFAIYRHTTRV